ncbi:head maturation protease, ClpP-related [Pandoraea sp. ISTKB]|uniref:head maturation protease, ClpP-related n=1 Tax=Pandoraea sp. ISTKB TaxID=1586708 RepID=UPI00084765EB|nr:head maturation protease, ClpP-related [Pandoraea sp. ISTKB]ODP33080.1 peptidase S14 [Pandoraea sp. ISTKB]
MKNRKWWDIRASVNGQGASVVEIRIYDEIGFYGMDAQAFMSQLDAAAGSAAEIVVAINSLGGDVFDAFAIYNALRRYPEKVTTRIDGVAASAASLVVMAGHRVLMPENAMLMIHNPWTVAGGDADQLRAYADMLDKAGDGIMAAYRNKSGKTDDELLAMMKAETWFTASEAVEAGFADEIEAPVKISASANSARIIARLTNIPESVKALLNGSGDSAAPPAPAPSSAAPQGDPVAEEPTALLAHLYASCRTANLSNCAEGIALATGLKNRASIDAAVVAATEIAGVCLAAKKPELTAKFVSDGLSPTDVRARLYDQLVSGQPKLNNHASPPSDAPVVQARGPSATDIYAARRGNSARK